MNRFIKFAVLSGGGWLLDCTLLLILSRLGVALGLSNFVSSATAALTVFLISRYWVFTSARKSITSVAIVYLLYQVCAIFAASLLIGPASAWAAYVAETAGFHLPGQWVAFWGKVLITPPQLVANFMVSRFLIQNLKTRTAHE